MMRRMHAMWTAAVVLSAALTGGAAAQDAQITAQNKLLAKRAAEADCYRKLAETVYGVQLNSSTYVRDFVTESDEIRTRVDAFIKGIRLGQPRYYDDGVCEIDGEVSVAKVVTHLKEVHAAHYKGNTVTTTDIQQITERIKTDVFRATGTGAPRPELPPGLPAGIEDVLEPLPQGYRPTLSVPPIWKTVGGQARLMAERAARLDAQRKLLEQIKGLRLTSDTLVRDFVTVSDDIAARAEGIVIGAYETGKYLHTDELIAEVTMAVPVEKIITSIQELHTQHYKGNKITTTDITNIKKQIKRDVIEATGAGVPPAQFVQQVQAEVSVQTPSWFTQSIEVYGEGAAPGGMGDAQARLMATRAAEMDAVRKLAEQIEGLQINSSTYVRDFVTQMDEIHAQVNSVIRGAVYTFVSYDGQVAKVKASLPAAEIWAVVSAQIRIEQRRR